MKHFFFFDVDKEYNKASYNEMEGKFLKELEKLVLEEILSHWV